MPEDKHIAEALHEPVSSLAHPDLAVQAVTDEPSLHHTTARATQSLEPILVPKLRIKFADFPYLHYSID